MYRFAKTKFWIYTALIMRKILIWGGVIAGLVAVLLVVAYLGSRSQEVKALTLSVPVSDADWKTGPASSSATLVEYSDFQCPACAAYYPVVKQLTKEFSQDLQFTYRYFPLSSIHKNARISSQAAESANKQNKFWEMHDLLFENQDEWANLADPKEKFKEYVRSIGLDTEKIQKDLESKEVKDKEEKKYQNGLS